MEYRTGGRSFGIGKTLCYYNMYFLILELTVAGCWNGFPSSCMISTSGKPLTRLDRLVWACMLLPKVFQISFQCMLSWIHDLWPAHNTYISSSIFINLERRRMVNKYSITFISESLPLASVWGQVFLWNCNFPAWLAGLRIRIWIHNPAD